MERKPDGKPERPESDSLYLFMYYLVSILLICTPLVAIGWLFSAIDVAVGHAIDHMVYSLEVFIKLLENLPFVLRFAFLLFTGEWGQFVGLLPELLELLRAVRLL